MTRTLDGWTAEIAIPFKTLRFRPDQAVWGFNVERQVKHLFETDRWAAARVTSWIGNLADAGQLTGLEGVRQGHGLDVRPYVSGGADAGDRQFAGGLDVFKNLTPNLNASVTINTDFAETEADIRQVNLTRFPLFFPEKRTFFLEGAGVFDIAGLAGDTDLLRPGNDLLVVVQSRVGESGTDACRKRAQRDSLDGHRQLGSWAKEMSAGAGLLLEALVIPNPFTKSLTH